MYYIWHDHFLNGSPQNMTWYGLSLCTWRSPEKMGWKLGPMYNTHPPLLNKFGVKKSAHYTRYFTVIFLWKWLWKRFSSKFTDLQSIFWMSLQADWPQPQPAIGRLANFSSLRKHRPKEYSIYDAYFGNTLCAVVTVEFLAI